MSVFGQIAQNPALRLSAIGMMLLGMQNASIAPYVSLIAIERVGLSEAAFSLVLTVAAVVSVVSAVLFGIMGDLRGRRRGIALFSAISALLGIAVMVAAPSSLTLVLCHAVLLPLGSSLYGQIFALARLASPAGTPGGSDRILSTIRAGMSVTFMTMLGFWTFAFGQGLDVMWTYSAAMVAAALAVGLVALQWPNATQLNMGDRPSGLSLRLSLGELAHPRVTIRLLILGTISSSFIIYFILIGLVFNASALRDASDVALYVGLVAAWEVPLLVLLPRLLPYIDRSRLIALGAGLYTLHIVMMPIWVDTIWLWAGTLIAGLGGTAFIGLTIGYYQDLLQGRPGAAGSMLALQKLVADILGAGAFALGMALGGFQTVAYMAFALTMGGAIALLVVDRKGLGPKTA